MSHIDHLNAIFDQMLKSGHLTAMMNSLDRISISAEAWTRSWLFPHEPTYYVFGQWCSSIRELGAP